MPMFGRVRHSVDFEAVLAAPARARSAHFAAHFLCGRPDPPRRRSPTVEETRLSTGDPEDCAQAVDDRSRPLPAGWWLGLVVPKRHARKATTRNLLRRLMRGAFDQHRPRLAPGIWLLRLRMPFDARRYRSAAPALLRQEARSELDGLLKRASL